MKRKRTEQSLESRLLGLLNDIINAINVAAALYKIRIAKSLTEIGKIPNPILLPRSEVQKIKGKNATVRKNEAQQTNLLVEEAKQKKVFK
jgi:hypothetical protein